MAWFKCLNPSANTTIESPHLQGKSNEKTLHKIIHSLIFYSTELKKTMTDVGSISLSCNTSNYTIVFNKKREAESNIPKVLKKDIC